VLQISVVIGNPKPQSRTMAVALALADKLLANTPHQLETIDLAEHTRDAFSSSERMTGLTERVAASDLAVFASPTYKATYSGLLKAFLDRYPSDGLAGVTAIPLLTGAGPDHAMGPTVNLAPLLVELGATIPGRGTYFLMQDMDRMDEVMEKAAAQYRRNLQQLAQLGSALVAGTPAAG